MRRLPRILELRKFSASLSTAASSTATELPVSSLLPHKHTFWEMTSRMAEQIGVATLDKLLEHKELSWFSPHMAAASRAIAERIPSADIVLEIRDARIPFSSEYKLLRHCSVLPRRHIVVLNKMDLAGHLHKEDWMEYFRGQNHFVFEVNSHNQENVKGLLKLLHTQVREMRRDNLVGNTSIIMAVGIPNVGKSALCNSLHQLSRISAEDKGKLKHAIISGYPGETKNIRSLKIGSKPSMYVLDTPGILPPIIKDAKVLAKLVLTASVSGDDLIGRKALAEYLLTVVNLSDEYKKWAKFSSSNNDSCGNSSPRKVRRHSQSLNPDLKTRKKQSCYPTDHTQDFIVHDVRRTLFGTISAYNGEDLLDESNVRGLMEEQFRRLRAAFRLPEEEEPSMEVLNKVSSKLLGLFRIGRLGHYTLDSL